MLLEMDYWKLSISAATTTAATSAAFTAQRYLKCILNFNFVDYR